MTNPIDSGDQATLEAEEPPKDGRPSAEELAQKLLLQARELWEYAGYYLSTKTDQARLSLHRLVAILLLGTVATIVAVSLLTLAGWFVISGMAGGFAQLFDSAWLGNLTAGVLAIGGVTLGLYGMLARRDAVFSKKMRLKYEQRRVQERDRFGHDVGSPE